MSAPAGMVNDRGQANDAPFEGLLSDSSEAVADIARAVRALVYDVLPATIEVVWQRQGSVGWGTGPKKISEHFAYLLSATHHVTLGFYHGGELPDPAGLLPTAGGRQNAGAHSMRSLRLASLEDVGQPALRELIRVATTVGVPPPRS